MRRSVIAVVILTVLAVGLAFTRRGRGLLASFGLATACSTDNGCD
jgi:hypothetical protein